MSLSFLVKMLVSQRPFALFWHPQYRSVLVVVRYLNDGDINLIKYTFCFILNDMNTQSICTVK